MGWENRIKKQPDLSIGRVLKIILQRSRDVKEMEHFRVQ